VKKTEGQKVEGKRREYVFVTPETNRNADVSSEQRRQTPGKVQKKNPKIELCQAKGNVCPKLQHKP